MGFAFLSALFSALFMALMSVSPLDARILLETGTVNVFKFPRSADRKGRATYYLHNHRAKPN